MMQLLLAPGGAWASSGVSGTETKASSGHWGSHAKALQGLQVYYSVLYLLYYTKYHMFYIYIYIYMCVLLCYILGEDDHKDDVDAVGILRVQELIGRNVKLLQAWIPERLLPNVGALIMRIGFWGFLIVVIV